MNIAPVTTAARPVARPDAAPAKADAQTPAQKFIATYKGIATPEYGANFQAVDANTVKITFPGEDSEFGDKGQADVDFASVAFNQSVNGVKLLLESGEGEPGGDGGFSLDDELGGWIWGLNGVGGTDMFTVGDDDYGLSVTPKDPKDAAALDALLVDEYSGHPIRVEKA